MKNKIRKTIFCGYRYYLGDYNTIFNFCIKNNLTMLKVKENANPKIYKNCEYYTKTPKWLDCTI